MAIDYEKLLRIRIPDGRQTYTERDTIIYALGIGYGVDPIDKAALRFCYEKDLQPTPTLPLVVAHPGFWMRDLDTGIDALKVVHGDQTIILHGPIPVAGTVVADTRVTEIIDKGAGRGALVTFERRLFGETGGHLIATMRQTNFCRGDGGFGGPNPGTAKPPPIPSRSPDFSVDLPTRPESALLYRQSADLNPLHADPAIAQAAGFPRPILHGLATFGLVGHAVLRSACGYDVTRLKALSGRFTSPVFPGETIRTDIWREQSQIQFRACAIERDVIVISSGFALVEGDSALAHNGVPQ